MATADARKIRKDIGFEGPDIEKRILSAGTTPLPMKPGHLVRLTSDDEFVLQNQQGKFVPTILLLEDKFQGDHTSGGGVDKTYAQGDPARAEFPPAGALRYVRVANGQTLVKGDELVFNGTGQLVKIAGTTTAPVKIVANSEEAITTSGEQLVLVRIA